MNINKSILVLSMMLAVCKANADDISEYNAVMTTINTEMQENLDLQDRADLEKLSKAELLALIATENKEIIATDDRAISVMKSMEKNYQTNLTQLQTLSTQLSMYKFAKFYKISVYRKLAGTK